MTTTNLPYLSLSHPHPQREGQALSPALLAVSRETKLFYFYLFILFYI